MAVVILSIIILFCKKFLTPDKGTRDGIQGGNRSLISDLERDEGVSPGDSGT